MYNTHMAKDTTGRNSRSTSKKSSTALDESFIDAPRRSVSRDSADVTDAEREAAERRRRAARLAAQKKRKKKRRTLILVLLFFLFAVALLVWAIIMLVGSCHDGDSPIALDTPQQVTTLDENATLPRGVTINGAAVGETTVAAARATVAAALENTLNSVAIQLNGDGIAATLTRTELGLSYDLDTALLTALNARGSAKTVSVPIAINEETARNALIALNDTIPNHAVNATFEVQFASSGAPTFVYTDGQNGMQLDYTAILASVNEAIAGGQYQTVIAPQVTISEPDITTEDLKAITSLRAAFTTEYKYRRTSSMTDDDVANAEARDVNITKAANIINDMDDKNKDGQVGTVIKPGDTFSFNDTTGKRSSANGWAEAKAVYDGSYRKETGGGVCQVTTTMFNALLRGGLFDITHREHSIPSDYVELGFDATVDYGTIDFKFRNDTDHDLYLFVYITQSSRSKYWKDIHVELYGEALPEGVEYRCSSVEEQHIVANSPEIIEDKKLPAGDEVITRNPHDKYVITISVDKFVNGQREENMFKYTTSKYELIQQQIRIGTSVAPTETPKEEPAPEAATPPLEGGG